MLLKKTVNIRVSETALWSLKDAESFKLSCTNNSENAAVFIDQLFDSAIDAISQDPTRYRYNAMLADKGIAIRERIDVNSQFRCLYEFNEENNTVDILLFISTKQDIEGMLYRCLILKK